MGYDERLVERLRKLLVKRAGVSEKKMFGGVAFLLDGKMFVGVNGTDLMVRVGPDGHGRALARAHARPMDFTGRPLTGFVYVSEPGYRGPALARWTDEAAGFVASLPKAARRPRYESRVPRSKTVDAWFAKYDNPMKDVVLRIREIILAADPRIEECIKWQAPTFTYLGNLASFYPKSKQHASLMFHLGAQIPGKHARLEGTGDTSRVMKLGSVAEANKARKDLEKVVRAWCDWRDRAKKSKTP